MKSKGERERYTHLNSEFQRIARRDKKAFFNEECEEVEENSRMAKTRGLFKKIGDTQGTLYASSGTIKDRSGKDITEAEEIKKRWQEYTEELYKNVLMTCHDGVVMHLEPNILESEVKWVFGSTATNKAQLKFQLSYLKSEKMMLLKCCI